MAQNLNQIGVFELTLEVGTTGLNQLMELGQWLKLPQSEIAVNPPQANIVRWQDTFLPQPADFGKYFPTQPRLAPSLICKGEVELFGQSMPRFAIRLYLNGEMGFLNVRRLGTFGGQLYLSRIVDDSIVELVQKAPCIADSFLTKPERLKQEWHVLSVPMAKANCEREQGEADVSYTPWVKHIKHGGGMCAQAACYMASSLHDRFVPKVHGLPEITYIATTTPEGPPANIGFDGLFTEQIADYFNSKDTRPLSAEWQVAISAFDKESIQPNLLSLDKSGLVINFDLALRSYILSDMPVIIPVDVFRMQGLSEGSPIKYKRVAMDGSATEHLLDEVLTGSKREDSIFRKNGLKFTHEKFTDENLSHVVIAVGCKRPEVVNDLFSTDHGHPVREEMIFCFNDPAHFPFMQATAHDLVVATSYEDTRHDSLQLGYFLPVTPRCVKMPFLDERQTKNTGIFLISEFLKSIEARVGGDIRLKVRKNKFKGDRPHFRLIRARREDMERALNEEYPQWAGNYGPLLDKFPNNAETRWCWLEMDGPATILVWNAQECLKQEELIQLGRRDIEAIDQPALAEKLQADIAAVVKRLLLAACIDEGGGEPKLHCDYQAALAPSPLVMPPLALKGELLEAALISSYEAVTDRKKVERKEDGVAVELYMFMQPMIEKLLIPKKERWRRWWERRKSERKFDRGEEFDRVLVKRTCGLTLMAEASQNEKMIRRVAKYCLALKRKPVAVATYLPSLSFGTKVATSVRKRPLDPADNKVPDPAQEPEDDLQIVTNPSVEALRFVLKVVTQMRVKRPQKAPLIIELVGGSRLLGRTDNEPATNPPPPGVPKPAKRQLQVRCIAEQTAVKNILLALEELLPEIERAQTRLAFEFEPSSLIGLGSLKSVIFFCEELEKKIKGEPDSAWKWVGLNLDIPHFSFIARHTPEQIPDIVKKFIFHTHISFHSFAHFADGILEDGPTPEVQEQKRVCMAYLLLIEELVEKGQHVGYISLELECAKTQTQVEMSLATLRDWLKPPKRPKPLIYR